MEWRQCENYPEIEVSEYGDLRIYKNKEKLEHYIDEDGYWVIKIPHSLNTLNKWFKPRVHRLVATAFY